MLNKIGIIIFFLYFSQSTLLFFDTVFTGNPHWGYDLTDAGAAECMVPLIFSFLLPFLHFIVYIIQCRNLCESKL